ncbi:VOC family protein [Pseudochryseolinea flava]|uniref:VOC family protein n=1 Tax=Pseudochryseolinea flava TaxID=2059302 RepID=A0A364Y3D0_9BACT|nr:VOC family protein [Pseudochryseolinea flava]RAW00854.1 VOC family protein [Pseudochryseolinea flava]
MQKITTFLTFNDRAGEAMEFYTSRFKDARITSSVPGPDGRIMTGTFMLNGQEFMALNGGPHFTFAEGISLFVRCETQEEIDYYYDTLSEDGEKQPCGWLKDKFGVSWQIIPSILSQLLFDKDRVKSKNVLNAMLQMKKIDIAKLKEAHAKE